MVHCFRRVLLEGRDLAAPALRRGPTFFFRSFRVDDGLLAVTPHLLLVLVRPSGLFF